MDVDAEWAVEVEKGRVVEGGAAGERESTEEGGDYGVSRIRERGALVEWRRMVEMVCNGVETHRRECTEWWRKCAEEKGVRCSVAVGVENPVRWGLVRC